ncbi:tetratricopeptide repeat protein [Streptomyces fumanus]|uniref:tetratricopeptide repeat protein n=1 Tax=Streptomyces fumanus TaxID=67302 RepID=UPI0033F9D03C
MEIRLRRRPARLTKRLPVAAAAGVAVLAGVLLTLPPERGRVPAPAPGPAAQAQTQGRGALVAGVPAALPALTALIGEHETRLRTRPRDGRAWAVLGAAYVERGRRTGTGGDFPRAERALRTALRLDPSPATLEGLAALAVARRDFRAGERWAEAARKRAPGRWTAQALLIDARTGLGDIDGVGRALERMTKLESSPAVDARVAAVYRDQGRREDAAARISDAAAAAGAPAERAAYLEQAGRLAFERGDREGALLFFQEALRTDPDQRDAQAGQGRALAALGRTTQALGAYRAALARQPRAEYALELGELYESLGLGQAARVTYDLVRERVRAAAVDGVDEGLLLGRFEADHGDPGAAVRALRAEWRRRPSTAAADALGWALHRAGHTRQALRYATRATDADLGGGVRSAPYAYHRGVIERALGRYGPARRHLAEALRINPYFSPLHAPRARGALAALGEPPLGDPPAS